MDPNGVCVHVHVHVHAYLPACSPVPSEAQQLGQAAEVCEGGIRGPSHGLHYLQLAPGQHLECATRHWWPNGGTIWSVTLLLVFANNAQECRAN